MVDSTLVLEWCACALGISGAYLLAANLRISRYAWFLLAAGQFSMIVLAVIIHRYGVMTQQAGFFTASLLGIYRTFLRGNVRPAAPSGGLANAIGRAVTAIPPAGTAASPRSRTIRLALMLSKHS